MGASTSSGAITPRINGVAATLIWTARRRGDGARSVAKKESSIYKAVAIPGEELTPHLPHVVVISLRYFCAETFKDCLEGWSASKARVHINTTHGVDDGGPRLRPINNCAPRSQRALRRRCRRRQESHLQNTTIRANCLLRPKQANHHQPPPKSGEITQNFFFFFFPGSSAIKTSPYIGLRSALTSCWLVMRCHSQRVLFATKARLVTSTLDLQTHYNHRPRHHR